MKKFAVVVFLLFTAPAFGQKVGDKIRVWGASAIANASLDYKYNPTPAEKEDLIKQMGEKEYGAFEKYVTKGKVPEGVRNAYLGTEICQDEVYGMTIYLKAIWGKYWVVKVPKKENERLDKHYINGDMFFVVEASYCTIDPYSLTGITPPTNAEVEKIHKYPFKRVVIKDAQMFHSFRLPDGLAAELADKYPNDIKDITSNTNFFESNYTYFKTRRADYYGDTYRSAIAKKAVAYEIAKFDEGKYTDYYTLVVIPLDVNRHFPDNAIPPANSGFKNIYIIVYTQNIEDYKE